MCEFDSQLRLIMLILFAVIFGLAFGLATIVVLIGRAYLRRFEEELRRDLHGGR